MKMVLEQCNHRFATYPATVHELDTTPKEDRAPRMSAPYEVVNKSPDKPKGGWWRRLTRAAVMLPRSAVVSLSRACAALLENVWCGAAVSLPEAQCPTRSGTTTPQLYW